MFDIDESKIVENLGHCQVNWRNNLKKFSERLKELRLGVENLSQDGLAKVVNSSIGTDFKRTTISNYETGHSEPNIDTIIFLAKFFNVSVGFLLGVEEKNIAVQENQHNLFQSYSIDNKPAFNEPNIVYLDHKDHEFIPLTDIKAAAGSGYINSFEVDEGNTISLPQRLLKNGKHICIRIKGDSMSPTMQDGGFAVIRFIERTEWEFIRDEYVYVVSDNEGHTYLKRCRNRFREHGFLVLTSDNPDKASNPNFNLLENEINSLWVVEWYFTAKMPNVHDDFFSRVKRIEDMVHNNAEELIDLKRILGTKKLI